MMIKKHSCYFAAIFLLSVANLPTASLADSVTPSEARQLRDEVRGMFYHAFDGYMNNAFPLDELRPLSCKGEDTLGGYALTLIDSLDTLALLGDHDRFGAAVEWIAKNVQFNIDKTVSVFETTIRILGGLLSAHLIASDYATGMKLQTYDDELLHLAEDLAQRLLPAFDTPTGIPFGSVNLMHGVDENESQITSTAGGGTLTLEFGVLSRLTNKPIYEEITKNAVRGIWARRSKLDLVGAHINVFTGEWTQREAGIGTSIDSFYEYLLKAYLLFGDDEYLFMFQEAYKAVMHHLHHDPWYVEVNMYSAATVWPLFNSLQAFWPGLQCVLNFWGTKIGGDQFNSIVNELRITGDGVLRSFDHATIWKVLAGDIDPAVRTHAAFFSVWKKYGFTPEGFNLATSSVQHGQKSYPLRPELIESTYWLFKATRDERYLDAGRDILTSIQYGARCTCGYCHIADVESHLQDDHMESFFLAETVKYLWLLFDLAVGPDNLVENGPYKYIFSTEGHLLPATPEISLVSEHCSYLGSFCKVNRFEEQGSHDMSFGYQDTNDTQIYMDRYMSVPKLRAYDNLLTSAYVKGVCPGLTHGQKFGVSYAVGRYQTDKEEESVNAHQTQRNSGILISHVASNQEEKQEVVQDAS